MGPKGNGNCHPGGGHGGRVAGEGTGGGDGGSVATHGVIHQSVTAVARVVVTLAD